MKKTPNIIQLPKITDFRGNLSFLESQNHIPINIKRAYWIYDVPDGDVIRGGHAFRQQEEFIIALSGSFDVLLDNGKRKKKFHLKRPNFGLYVPAGTWRSMANFSTNSLALVLASTYFDENDYVRDYRNFLTLPELQESNSLDNIETASPVINSDVVFENSSMNDCTITQLEKNHTDKGSITVIENHDFIPFDIERVYYLYDVPGFEERGGHAHKELHQLIIAANGSFDILLDDGNQRKTITLNRPYQGLKIVPGIWRELFNFSAGASCLVLASHKYDENDYIRDKEEFLAIKKNP